MTTEELVSLAAHPKVVAIGEAGLDYFYDKAPRDAQAKGFATSFVVVSDNDLRFHKFEEVYRKIVSELGTAT